MAIKFMVASDNQTLKVAHGPVLILTPDNWDNFSFKTAFELSYFDDFGKEAKIGSVKIAFKGQGKGRSLEHIPKQFETLSPEWFSLGQDVDYYKHLQNALPDLYRHVLQCLGDIVESPERLQLARNEVVFDTSLMRTVSESVIHGQYRRVMEGKVELTDFHFRYVDKGDQTRAAVSLEFKVDAASKPSTNVHVLIGRNGVGKTTLLNSMVCSALAQDPHAVSRVFLDIGMFGSEDPMSSKYFSSVVSVSFSAFDPFVPPADRTDPGKGTKYFYVGMKRARAFQDETAALPPKSDSDLIGDMLSSLMSCLSQSAKRERWSQAIARLQSDPNFAELDLQRIAALSGDAARTLALKEFRRLSSGHAIVLLTVTKLVDTVEEKTLVLVDEPESHLHPPLLSAFMRALAELLHSRNGVAIIATHSPVVLQEVPRSCVWKLSRLGLAARTDRPERECFGENVGVLTREVFGLEVAKAGFHELLEQNVNKGGTFEEIQAEYNFQLGQEALSILRSLIFSRDNSVGFF